MNLKNNIYTNIKSTPKYLNLLDKEEFFNKYSDCSRTEMEEIYKEYSTVKVLKKDVYDIEYKNKPHFGVIL